MAHRGESFNGRHYSTGYKRRGFDRLNPVAAEETSKERMLREVEEEKKRRRQRVIPDQPSRPIPEEPKPQPKPQPKDPYEGLDKDEIEELKRRERFRKALGNK